jgi:hypothetical protein
VVDAFGISSFQSIWYWVLSVIAWTLVTHSTLGVPYDMILRARRAAAVSERVDQLAHIHAGRIAAIYESAGPGLALAGGFGLAALYGIGFLEGVELAQAAFMLAFPLSAVAYSTLGLALAVRAHDFRGPALVRVLARRRFWHQVVAVVGMLGALGMAAARHPLFLN